MAYESFRIRQNATGVSIRDAHLKTNIDIINAGFRNSLGYSAVTMDGVNHDAVLLFGKTQDDRSILFRPLTSVVRGSLVTVGTDTWLMTDVEQNDLYPKSVILKCNQLIKWDSHQSLAVVTSKARAYGLEQSQLMDLPRGEYSLQVPYNTSTRLIKEDTRFVINGGAYSVIGYDNITHILEGRGIITVHIKDDLNRSADDLTGGLAEQKKPGGWNNW